ncbi:MAG: response regulator transcription factor [Lachnospiraceae bacterium]|nr:response regulator transcription factor [Lachnospiraceae bacterium]
MKLLLAEDTSDLNKAVTAILKHEDYEVDSVFDGEKALQKILETDYDGVILDIMMPGKDGIEVLKEMRKRHILVPVLLLTAKAEIDDRVAGLDAGADDYLPKPFAMKELLARIRSMTRRYMEYESVSYEYEDLILDPKTFSLSARNSISLSVKEFELMQMFLANVDIGFSTEHILEKVWKNERNARPDTVWLYVSYLKGKLASIGSKVDIEGERGGTYTLVIKSEQGGTE